MSSGVTTNYEKYIRTEELLNLQKKETEMCCSDELTYQTLRQISELHFKLIIQYLEMAIEYLEAKNIPYTTNQLRRVDQQLKHLPEVFKLINVIDPADYHTIQSSVETGNDYDSPGFTTILKLVPSLWRPFKKLLDEQQLTVLDLLKKGDTHYELFQLMQEMIAFDEGFQTLCFYHNKVFRRMNGLDSNRHLAGAKQIQESSLQYELFPEIWSGISVLTESTFPGFYFNPLE